MFRAAAHGGRVEQQKIGRQAHTQQPTVGHAEHAGRVRGEPAHRFAHAHHAALASPVPEQVQAEAGVVEEGEVGAGVAQADDAVRVVQHAADRLFVAVEQLRGEDGAQVFGDGQVEHHVERVAALGARDVGHVHLLEPRVRGQCHLDHLDLVPFIVEEPEGRRRREFGAHAVAERRIGEQFFQGFAGQGQRRLPTAQALDRVGRREREVHRQRAARHLAEQPVPARVGRGDGIEVVEHGLRVGAVVQQCCDHHRPAALCRQRFEERHRRVPALGQHVDTAPCAAHRVDQRRHLALVGQA